MRQPTKSELSTENAKLRRENDVLRFLVMDLLRGEAAIAREGAVTWLISRPGAGNSGSAVSYSYWEHGDGMEVGTIDEVVHTARMQRSLSYGRDNLTEAERERVEADAGLAGMAERISQIGMGENCAPKLPSILGDFHRAKLG